MNLLEFISNELLISERKLKGFINTAPYRYKVYSIPKRNSDAHRVIAQPSKELKQLQRLLISHLEKHLKVHSCAMAYEKGKNIKLNASPHKDNDYLLKLDFENFFPSIKPIDLLHFLERSDISLSEVDRFVVERLFFWRSQRGQPLSLSIGAPSSPFISNSVMFDFDSMVVDKLNNIEVSYTRYADDLTFSTSKKNALFDIPRTIEDILANQRYPSLKINKTKTVFSSKKHNRHITGITISNSGKLSLGRERKRRFSSMIHKFKCGSLDKDEVNKLNGYISFALDIEPEFIDRMKKKYGTNVVDKIREKALRP
jgi:retron-type reverse transcriptase